MRAARLLLMLAWLASSPELRADDVEGPRPPPEPNPFRHTYVALEAVRNDPISFSEQRFSPGTIEPAFTYLHELQSGDDVWLMGLGAQMKVFRRNDIDGASPPSSHLAMLTLFHEILYGLRLSYPTYLLLGPKLLYLYPSDTGKLPPVRDEDYQLEVGAALTAQLAYLLGDGKRMLTLRLDRWRGMNTQKLMGVEIGAGMAWELN